VQGWVTAVIDCSHLRPESSKSDGDAVSRVVIITTSC